MVGWFLIEIAPIDTHSKGKNKSPRQTSGTCMMCLSIVGGKDQNDDEGWVYLLEMVVRSRSVIKYYIGWCNMTICTQTHRHTDNTIKRLTTLMKYFTLDNYKYYLLKIDSATTTCNIKSTTATKTTSNSFQPQYV